MRIRKGDVCIVECAFFLGGKPIREEVVVDRITRPTHTVHAARPRRFIITHTVQGDTQLIYDAETLIEQIGCAPWDWEDNGYGDKVRIVALKT